jgi:GNAT superfamily N-acetyltransferase
MGVSVERLQGSALIAALDALATLRIAVFADFPYLYEGDAGYEREYLREFASEPESVLIAAMDGERIVGAATASPMAGQKPEFRRPFEERGHAIARLFYFGESVLLPAYREQGIGHAFFDRREEAARMAGASHACFCAVVRAEDDPHRPEGYRPLDDFWRGRGYKKAEGLTTVLEWKTHDSEDEIPHTMQFWIGAL